MRFKHSSLAIGIAFFVALLIGFLIAASAHDEPPAWSVYFLIGLPLAQAAMFAAHRSNRDKQLLGSAILVVMGVCLAVSFLAGIGQFLILFFGVAFASALFHAFHGFFMNEEPKKTQTM